MKRLILASASPRRLDLLKQIQITPDLVIPADIDEVVLTGEKPGEHALRLAQEKAQKIAADHQGAYILAADTVVGLGRRILPKAEHDDDVRECLRAVSGRRHHVYGGIALITPDGKLVSRLCDTVVQFKRLSGAEIESYIQTGEGIGKAGGYAIQGYASAFVKFIRGSHSNIVGLSLYDTMQLLHGNAYFKGE